ncbi:hypothetical protein GR927_36045 [Mycolicibacterium sp. 3033]|nr:hypothetical protein [Mycolicibacterium aurantiacum]
MSECDGTGRYVPDDQPSARAATCPVCGRETPVEPEETDDGLRFSVAPHDAVG